MTRLRIAMVSANANLTETPDGVGQNTHVAELARALGARGHEVRIHVRRDSADGPDTVPLAENVTVERVPVGPAAPVPTDDLLPIMGDFGRWLAARWADDPDGPPDLVHAHFWMSGLAALTATAARRLPVVVNFHGPGAVRRRYESGTGNTGDTRVGLERTLTQLADRVLARSTEEVDELALLGLPRSRVTVVPSGVDTDRFTPTGPVAARSEDFQRILVVGRLDPHKGHEDLIKVLRRLPEAELVIAGGPPPAELTTDPRASRLRALAEQCKVADRVTLLGAVPDADLPALYRSADVFCCVSRYEPCGLTVLEAMASGVPVVTYAVGGPAESVIDGVTGVHVPALDVRELAAALRGLLADEVRRMSFASAAVDRVRSRYTWPRAAGDTERAYAAVLGRESVDSLTDVPG